MWNIKSAALAVLIFSAGAQWLPPVAPSIRQQIVRAAIVADFEHRFDQYVGLHRLLQAILPPIVYPNSPAEVRRATAAQRDAIRRARANAREGDIFTPEIGDYFKWLIANGCNRDYVALLKQIEEEFEPLGTARINEPWPGATLTMMPPGMLATFPPLPTELEYHFVHHDLVLWDKQVDLVVDVLRNAIPADADHNGT
jgi:hypothetical protein